MMKQPKWKDMGEDKNTLVFNTGFPGKKSVFRKIRLHRYEFGARISDKKGNCCYITLFDGHLIAESLRDPNEFYTPSEGKNLIENEIQKS